jgi:hypothetical protein
MRAQVTDGASNDSPRAIVRMPSTSSAGGASLSRNPLAPARSASQTYSSTLKVVTMSTIAGVSTSRPAICRLASMPSSTGIRMSMTTTSGRSRRAASTAARPSSTSPTTSMSACVEQIVM